MVSTGKSVESNLTTLSCPNPWTSFAVFTGLFLLTLFLQHHNGAFSNDFGAHSDEASHVVTGLMVRDYIAGPLLRLEHPMRFAETYYEHFPKVALGHYPPGFYAIEGLWLLPSRSKTAIILLMTTLTATTAFIIWLVGRRLLLPANAILAAATFILIPLIQTYTAIVMSDMLLVIFCLLATLSFGRFVETKKIRWSLLFGLLAAAAILTKGSGLLLALVPPFAIVISRQFRLITNWRLWVAPIPVVVLALPWMLATRHITDEGMQHVPLSENIPAAVSYYFKVIPQTFGIILTLLLIIALLLPLLHRKFQLPSLPGIYYPLFSALLLSILLFYIVVPAGLDARYLLPALPFTILLSFSFIQNLSTKYKAQSATLIPLFFSVLIVLENGMPAKKKFTGSHQGLSSIINTAPQADAPDKAGRKIVLISSDPKGEGALIAEGCLSWPETLSFRRSSKVLSESDWLGRDYKSTFETPAQLKDFLREQIDFVIIDTGIPKYHLRPHHSLLQSTLTEASPENFTLISTIDSNRRSSDSAQFIIYR
ncbi:MAG: phospholipid carrier-dependent glycosyltransferase [Verrucomicrobia bacterium]|nr:phospholipid carrier-dependent glycosyltransferase [Verrucomicrobiota bacterium]